MQPTNTPETPSTPPVTTQAPELQQTPFSPLNTEPMVAQPQIPQPPKRKKLIVSLVVAAVLIIGAVITLFVLANNQTTKANEAANGYSERVLASIEAIKSDDAAESLKALEDRAMLEKVAFGETLSSDYKEATEIQTKYNTLVDNIAPFFKEAHMFFELPELNKELSAIVSEQLPDSSASIDRYIIAISSKSDKYKAFADKLNAQYFDEKYAAAKQDAVNQLQTISDAYKQMADTLLENVNANTTTETSFEEQSTQVSENYEKVRNFFSTTVVRYGNELAKRLPGEAKDAREKIDTFTKSLE